MPRLVSTNARDCAYAQHRGQLDDYSRSAFEFRAFNVDTNVFRLENREEIDATGAMQNPTL
jgi:hypothetical protein